MFRLHIDIPLGTNEESAIAAAEHIIDIIQNEDFPNNVQEVEIINYRLCQDGERNNANYLNKDENGRALGKKLTL